MFEHIPIDDDKSTHISFISVYTMHIFCLHAGIFIYMMIVQFDSTISSFINIYMAITELIIAKYINIHGNISVFIISFHM